MRKLKFLLIGFFVVFLISCQKEFMERFPLDKINDANFWNSPSDLKIFSNQFYPSLIDPNNFWRIDNMSDNMAPSSLPTFIWNQYAVPSSGGGWSKSDWSDIRSCNYFLKEYNSVAGDNSVIDQYLAEILFFKSFFYYSKVKQFGDVPWLFEVLDPNSDQLMGLRDNREVVMDSLIKNLNFAIENLPEESNEDRLTKYAALAFKTRVCLFEGTYRKYHDIGNYEGLLREVVSSSEKVINSGRFSLFSTGDSSNDYYDLFSAHELRDNSECIMAQYYAYDKLMHNRNRSINEPQTGFTKDFVNSYLCIDGKPISISPLYKGDTEFLDEFTNRDPRLRQSIYTPDRPILISSSGAESFQPVPEFNNSRCNTGYRVIKFFSPFEKDIEQGRCIMPTIIFRYAEVLLNYVEAKEELNECTQEVLDNSLNLLRDRVGMPNLSVNIGYNDPDWPNWEIPITPLLNEIRRERRIELAAEGFRFDDLRRWKAGKLLDNPKTYLGARDAQTGSYRILYPGFSRTWEDKLYLYPLPISELTMNSAINQNPGW